MPSFLNPLATLKDSGEGEGAGNVVSRQGQRVRKGEWGCTRVGVSKQRLRACSVTVKAVAIPASV